MELHNWKTWFFVWKCSNSFLKTNSSWIWSALSHHSQLTSLMSMRLTSILPSAWATPWLRLELSKGNPSPPARAHLSALPLKCSTKIGGKDWQGLLKEAEYFKAKSSVCWAAKCGNLHRRAKRERFSVMKHSGISWLGWGRRIGIRCCWIGKFTNRIYQI